MTPSKTGLMLGVVVIAALFVSTWFTQGQAAVTQTITY